MEQGGLLLGLMLPFLGTALGAAAVFLMKDYMNCRLEALLIGIAAGVMTAASVWSLLLPAIELSGGGRFAFIPACAGFLSGVLFLMLSDRMMRKRKQENLQTRKTGMMVFAVTLHNIPEGMAVGIALSAAMQPLSGVSLASAMVLSLGIAIQNVPEGAIISMPLKANGCSKMKAFWKGMLSGAVEPAAGALTIFLTSLILPIMPYLLSFAAGAMIYVVVEELIPDLTLHTSSYLSAIAFSFGFVLMMSLDVAFS